MDIETTSRVRDVQKAIRVLSRLAQYDNKKQRSTALTLLYIARHQDRPEGVTTGDLTKWIGMTPASTSRNQYYWGEAVTKCLTPDMASSR